MNLFSKEKGLIFSILNSILFIWLLVSIILTISNFTSIVVKDHFYTYEEYKVHSCDFEYDTEEDCRAYYTSYKLDKKDQENIYKRNIIICLSEVILLSGVLIILNKPKKN